ncbi:hypothetical protein ACWEOA_07250, partial [Streptomyces sp. NPDC004457]
MTDGSAAIPKDETPDPTGTREPVTGGTSSATAAPASPSPVAPRRLPPHPRARHRWHLVGYRRTR